MLPGHHTPLAEHLPSSLLHPTPNPYRQTHRLCLLLTCCNSPDLTHKVLMVIWETLAVVG